MDQKTKNAETIYVITQKDTYRDEIPDLSACTSKERAEERFHDILDALWDPDDPEHKGMDNNGNTYEECLRTRSNWNVPAPKIPFWMPSSR